MDDKKLQKRIDFLEGLIVDLGIDLLMLVNQVNSKLLPDEFQSQLSKDQMKADKRRYRNLLEDVSLLLARKMQQEK